ncbi:UNKNOWN [Stylonychia lemnae]|uniref:Uncharacterized protein n=1 Tax=Stylonychia lemnae TaxID=5949 RepID=A0A078B364_STYLE|nr:UNKNOWN [Stylonychia lemnae]|eukprot:CDW88711.1 UNKNOWN [Stylonychia lemnae]
MELRCQLNEQKINRKRIKNQRLRQQLDQSSQEYENYRVDNSHKLKDLSQKNQLLEQALGQMKFKLAQYEHEFNELKHHYEQKIQNLESHIIQQEYLLKESTQKIMLLQQINDPEYSNRDSKISNIQDDEKLIFTPIFKDILISQDVNESKVSLKKDKLAIQDKMDIENPISNQENKENVFQHINANTNKSQVIQNCSCQGFYKYECEKFIKEFIREQNLRLAELVSNLE